MDVPIWLYWEGPCPDWIAACRRTILAHGQDVRALDWAAFDGLWQHDRDIGLAHLVPAHRSDFIRSYLLAHHGGLWVDADCVVLRPLQPVLGWLDRHDFAGYRERQGHISNNFMAAAPGSRIAAAYYARVCEVLRSGRRLSWLSLGSDSLTATVDALGVPWLRLGYDLVQPVCWSEQAAFFNKGDQAAHERVFNTRSLCYMLSNDRVQRFEAEHPGRSLLEEGTFFRYLLERAAGEVPAQPARSTSMGTSNWQQIPFAIEAMLGVAPERVLDVGVGFGRWGMLVREFCEEWRGRVHRENWAVRLEGIEVFPKNVEEYHHLIYDSVQIGDAAAILRATTAHWDLAIFGDVLQHWPKETGWGVLLRALDVAKYVLVNVPVGLGWERGAIYGNPHEEHRSYWLTEELLALEPVRHALFRDPEGRDYGAFLLSAADPKQLRA